MIDDTSGMTFGYEYILEAIDNSNHVTSTNKSPIVFFLLVYPDFGPGKIRIPTKLFIDQFT